MEYVPGLYKIFDEILVNAADNYQRDKKMTTIKVKIKYMIYVCTYINILYAIKQCYIYR